MSTGYEKETSHNHVDPGHIRIEHIADYQDNEARGYIDANIRMLEQYPTQVQAFEEGNVLKLAHERLDDMDVTSIPESYRHYLSAYEIHQEGHAQGLLGMYLMEFTPSEEICPRLHVHPYGERTVIITTDNQTSVTVRAKSGIETNSDVLSDNAMRFRESWFYMDYDDLPEDERSFVVPPNTSVAVRIPPNTAHAFLTQGSGKAIAWSVHPVEAHEVTARKHKDENPQKVTMGALTEFLEDNSPERAIACSNVAKEAAKRMQEYPDAFEKGIYIHKNGIAETADPPHSSVLRNPADEIFRGMVIEQRESGLLTVKQ